MMLYQYILLAVLPLFQMVFALPPPSTTTPLDKRDITCLKVDSTATATWVNAAGQTCTFEAVVGSNFGVTSSGSDYSCNGRCGAGCSGFALGNAYTQNCFSHDICSFFNNATGGASDPNCGKAFNAAVDDTLFGIAAGCSQTNPSVTASAPVGTPKCS